MAKRGWYYIRYQQGGVFLTHFDEDNNPRQEFHPRYNGILVEGDDLEQAYSRFEGWGDEEKARVVFIYPVDQPDGLEMESLAWIRGVRLIKYELPDCGGTRFYPVMISEQHWTDERKMNKEAIKLFFGTEIDWDPGEPIEVYDYELTMRWVD